MESLIRLLERFKLRWSSIAYDSRTHPAEAYYATIYMDHFTKHLDDLKTEQRLKILDAGCGTGRFSVPLANQGYQIQAIIIIHISHLQFIAFNWIKIHRNISYKTHVGLALFIKYRKVFPGILDIHIKYGDIGIRIFIF